MGRLISNTSMTVDGLCDVGAWFVAEGNGQMPDGSGAATTVLTLGYSPSKGKYVGTWIGSMMDHMWIYDGEVSPDGSGGAPAESPQGQTPPGMQAAPEGSSKTIVDEGVKK